MGQTARARGVPLSMSRIQPEFLDADRSSRSRAADVLVRDAHPLVRSGIRGDRLEPHAVLPLGVGALSSVLFGLLPAFQASNPRLVDALKEGGRTGAGGAKGQRMRNSLVIAEVAVREGMRRLRDDGLEKVKRGLTSMSEVARVTGSG